MRLYSSKSSNFVGKELQMRNIIINFVTSKYEKNGKYGDYKERRPKKSLRNVKWFMRL